MIRSMLNKAIEKILHRKRAYRQTFLDTDGEWNPTSRVVLADLRRFCRASTSTVMVSPVTKQVDPIAMAMAEGRREVWNRIMAHLYVDEKQVFELTEDDDG